MNPLILSEFDCFLPVDIVHTNSALSSHLNAHVHSKPAGHICTFAQCYPYLKYETTYEFVCKVANTAYFERWYEKLCYNSELQLEQYFNHCYYYWFRTACINGHIIVLEFFAKHLKKSRIEAALIWNGFEAFLVASVNGHTNVLDFFAHQFSQSRLEAAFDANKFIAFIRASEFGHANVLEFFACRFDSVRLKAAFKSYAFSAFKEACANGHTNVLQFFTRHFSQELLNAAFESVDFVAFHAACANGQRASIEFCASQFNQKMLNEAFCADNFQALYVICEHGYYADLYDVFERCIDEKHLVAGNTYISEEWG